MRQGNNCCVIDLGKQRKNLNYALMENGKFNYLLFIERIRCYICSVLLVINN